MRTSDVPISWLNPSSCIKVSRGLLGSEREREREWRISDKRGGDNREEGREKR